LDAPFLAGVEMDLHGGAAAPHRQGGEVEDAEITARRLKDSAGVENVGGIPDWKKTMIGLVASAPVKSMVNGSNASKSNVMLVRNVSPARYSYGSSDGAPVVSNTALPVPVATSLVNWRFKVPADASSAEAASRPRAAKPVLKRV
jgi:hypothetical protein